MEYFWWLYLVTRLDPIRSLLEGGMFFMVLAVGGSGLFLVCFWGDEQFQRLREWWVKKAKWFVLVFVFCAAFWTLIPSKQDAFFIAGGIGVIEGAKALRGSETAKKSVAFIEQWLENNLEELREKAETKSNKRR